MVLPVIYDLTFGAFLAAATSKAVIRSAFASGRVVRDPVVAGYNLAAAWLNDR